MNYIYQYIFLNLLTYMTINILNIEARDLLIREL